MSILTVPVLLRRDFRRAFSDVAHWYSIKEDLFPENTNKPDRGLFLRMTFFQF